MSLSPEVMIGVILAVLFGAVLVGLAALSRVPAKRGVILLGGLLILAGASVGLGVVTIPSDEPPVAESLFSVVFLSTSDTDRTESGENIAADGHALTYTMSDANADGLGDVNLDVRVTNNNIGAADDLWAFSAEIVSVGFTQVSSSGPAQYVINRTDLNSRWAVSYSETSAGAPTISQEGEKAVSRDWKTGASDVLNIDLEMSPTAMDDLAAGQSVSIVFLVGGVTLTLMIFEGV